MAQINQDPSSEPEKEINILLVGESGVGKSTFINSCFNYLKFNTLQEVLDDNLQVLIPCRISMEDVNHQQKEFDVQVNYEPETSDDANEVLTLGKAGTQGVFTYIFSIYVGGQKYKVRFLDTPGMGDERGAKQDQVNCDLILDYLAQLKEIHGFCILLKPLNSRLDVFMNYCVVQILSRLESSAVKNVVFVFTNTRGQNFTAGHTYTPLKVLLDNIRKNNNLSIPLNHENMFCFDNEPFRYVAAVKNGVQLHKRVHRNTEDSWEQSADEFWRLLEYITQLKPHDLKKTISVNDARTMASYLSEPIADIMQLIQSNITSLNQHTKELSQAELTKEELRKRMHTPKIDIKIRELEYPDTVCTHSSCTTIYEVNGINKLHYNSRCCTECNAFAKPGVVGSAGLYWCHAFGWNADCRKCDHSVDDHKHIFYETEVYKKPVDESMRPAVNSHEELVKLKEDLIKNQKQLQQEYEYERAFILQSSATLDQYLKKNTLTPAGNPMEEYLKCQIARESTRGGNDKAVSELNDLLAKYELEKQNIEAGRSEHNREVTPEEIEEIKQKLMNLKHFGATFKQLYNVHQAGVQKNLKRKEKTVIGKIKGYFKKNNGK